MNDLATADCAPRARLARRGASAWGDALLLVGLAYLGAVASPARPDDPPRAGPRLVVTSIEDSGPGSLREAILRAVGEPGAVEIAFDPMLFAEPRVIELRSELPSLTGDLTIDGYIPDRLWEASGVTLSGAGSHRVLRVGPGGRARIAHVTIADGLAAAGGGIENRGNLVVHGVTFLSNRATEDGGGLANLEGRLSVVNSTFSGNSAGLRGGGLANLGGAATLRHATFWGNLAATGGGLFNAAPMNLVNSIAVASRGGLDCVSETAEGVSFGVNLMLSTRGCGEPILAASPGLEPLGLYNGPTPTHPLSSASPAVNAGESAESVDETGAPLVWDQRGQGDPRFVAGYADLGAFELQRFPELVVDTVEDNGRRGCTPVGEADCSLRGAIELANADDRHRLIRFDPGVFVRPVTLALATPLPAPVHEVTLDASDTAGVTIDAARLPSLEGPAAPRLILAGVTVLGREDL
jgi:hypothetical protein